jgi:hypothetical protein
VKARRPCSTRRSSRPRSLWPSSIRFSASRSVRRSICFRISCSSARDDLKKKGLLPTLERTDLFIHQCRQEWGSLGLVETEQVAAQLDAERRRHEADGRANGNSDETIANYVLNQLGAPLVAFHSSVAPRVTARELGKAAYMLDDGPHSTGVLVFGSDFTLDCKVFLEADGKGIRVRRFSYDVRSTHLHGGRATNIHRGPGGTK